MHLKCAFFVTKHEVFSSVLCFQVTAEYILSRVQQIFLFLNQPNNSKLSLDLYVCFSKDWVKLNVRQKVKSTVECIPTYPIPISMNKHVWIIERLGNAN